MTTFELYIKNRLHRFSGPSCWEELTPKQAIAIMRVRGLEAADRRFLFPILRILYGMKLRHMRWLYDESFLGRQKLCEEDRLHGLWQGSLLLEELKWIHESDPEAVFPVGQFRVNDFYFGTPGRWFKAQFERTVYQGPNSGLGNCTFEEFIWADKAYRDQDWPRLAAVLYRPLDVEKYPYPKKMVDLRDTFHTASLDARAKRFETLNPALLALITFNYECSLFYLKRVFKRVFSGGEAGGKAQKSGSPWLDITLVMAQMDVTKVAAIEKTNLYLALKAIDKNIEQVEALESKK